MYGTIFSDFADAAAGFWESAKGEVPEKRRENVRIWRDILNLEPDHSGMGVYITWEKCGTNPGRQTEQMYGILFSQ
jgi:hypothetical protein